MCVACVYRVFERSIAMLLSCTVGMPDAIPSFTRDVRFLHVTYTRDRKRRRCAEFNLLLVRFSSLSRRLL